MNWVDLLIVAVVAWTTFRAFSVGLIREVVTLVAVVAGILLAGAFYDNLSANLEFLIEDQTTRNLIAFVSILAGTMVAGQVLGGMLKQFANLLLLGPLDHIGGAAFGFLKGMLVVEVALLALAIFPAIQLVSRSVDDSRLAPFFLDTVPVAEVGLPSEFQHAREQLDAWRERLNSYLQTNGAPDAADASAPAAR